MSVTDDELSSIFGRKGLCSRGMIYEYLHHLSSSHGVHRGWPRLVSEDLEPDLVRFYLTRQRDNAPITVSDLVNLLAVQDVNVDRFRVG
jgi:hypothetical protein